MSAESRAPAQGASHISKTSSCSLQKTVNPRKRATLLEHAEQLVVDLCQRPPAVIEPGVLYQLTGKEYRGVKTGFLIVFPEHCLVGDFETGLVVQVDGRGNRNKTRIGGGR